MRQGTARGAGQVSHPWGTGPVPGARGSVHAAGSLVTTAGLVGMQAGPGGPPRGQHSLSSPMSAAPALQPAGPLLWEPGRAGRHHHHQAGLLDGNQSCLPEALLGSPVESRESAHGRESRGGVEPGLLHYPRPPTLGERRPGRGHGARLLRGPHSVQCSVTSVLKFSVIFAEDPRARRMVPLQPAKVWLPGPRPCET